MENGSTLSAMADLVSRPTLSSRWPALPQGRVRILDNLIDLSSENECLNKKLRRAINHVKRNLYSSSGNRDAVQMGSLPGIAESQAIVHKIIATRRRLTLR
jgi:hypothetical protein